MLRQIEMMNEFHQKIKYKIPQIKEGQLEKELYKLRKRPKEEKYVSSRQILGEYIDNLRANMGYNNKDLSQNIKTTSFTISEIQCRLYAQNNEEGPCIIMIHGGAFIGGSVEVVENPCKLLSQYINGKVISIDYSLAPEKPYPYAIEECVNVCKYIFQNKDRFHINDIYIMGDSAGGNIAIAVSQYCHWLKGMILLYPLTDLSLKVYRETWNEKLYNIVNDDEAKKCIHSLEHIESLINKLYVQNNDRKDPFVSPIYQQNISLNTLIISAEFDYLRIQGEYFASLLKNKEVIRYGGINHAFLDKLGDLPQAEDCLFEISQWIRRNKNVKL